MLLLYVYNKVCNKIPKYISSDCIRDKPHHETGPTLQQFLLKTRRVGSTQAMLPALDAILGHRSAHSLATGPVMAEPEAE